jgi:hypothetical protein
MPRSCTESAGLEAAGYKWDGKYTPESEATSILDARNPAAEGEFHLLKSLRYPLHCQLLTLFRAVEKIKVN